MICYSAQMLDGREVRIVHIDWDNRLPPADPARVRQVALTSDYECDLFQLRVQVDQAEAEQFADPMLFRAQHDIAALASAGVDTSTLVMIKPVLH